MSDPSPIDRLRALIAGDTMLQDELAAITDESSFVVAATAAARRAGFAIEADMVGQASRGDPLGLSRFDGAPPTTVGWPGRAWLPSAIIATSAGPAVDWTHFADLRLTDPFFAETIHTARRRPLNNLLRVRTPLAELDTAMPPGERRMPDALIFHMSRCGSTLVSQMLAAVPGNVVVSEAAPFDSILLLAHTHPEIPIDRRVGLLRAMAAALGRDRFGDRKRFAIKLDAWHTLALPLLRAAFPDTPWIFLFRDPIEVMVSHMRAAGAQTVPGAMPPGLHGFDESVPMPHEQYTARVLGAICSAAIEHRALGEGMFVDYASLPDAVEQRILPHFGIVPSDAERAAMRAATAHDAKATRRSFAPDSRDKQTEASDAVRAAVDDHLAVIHRQLRALAEETPVA